MKLKNKIVLVSLGSISLFCLMVIGFQKLYILPTYSKIEQSEAGKDLCQAYVLLMKDIKDNKLIAENIAKSKDVYSLKNHKNTIKISQTDIFDGLPEKLNTKIILIFNNKKKLTYKKIQSEFENININSLVKYIKNKNILFDGEKNHTEGISGLLSTSRGIFIIASIPIFNPDIDKLGGTTVICYPLDKNYFNKLSMQVKSPVYIYDLNYQHKQLPLTQKVINSIIKTSSIYFYKSTQDSNFSSSYRAVKDINNKPVFLLAASLSRNIYLEAHSMVDSALYVMILFGVLLIFLTTNVIQYIVVKPLSKLTKSTIKIRHSKNLKLRTKFHFRNDEIGILSSEFNNLLKQIQHHIEDMEEIIEEKTIEIRSTREDTIFRLSMAIDDKDAGTGKHMKRVRQMILLLGEKMKFNRTKCEMYSIACSLHDIGKIGVPEYILGKTGKYTKDEYEAMKTHTIIGGKIFSGSNSELVITAREIALYHHEHWDGSGYPEGLKGDTIPLPARMMTIIDVFNGMLSKRTYKNSILLEEVIKHFKENSGKFFDPDILKVFLENIDCFVEIREKYPDKL